MYFFKHLFVLKSAFYFSLFSATSYAQFLVDDEGCRTPDRGVGDCIVAKFCKPLVDFLMQVPKPVSEEVRLELNKYMCGYDSGIKVCCPSGPIVIKTMANVETVDLENPPPPPDVSNHRNFKLLPEECGLLPIPDKIRDGKNANLHEFPWMALISYNTNEGPKFKCGGSILNEKYILTAAHCITDLVSPLLGVRVGEYAISTKVDCETLQNQTKRCSKYPVQNLAIEEVVVHSNFSKEVINDDIGLLRVTRMNLNVENVRPVCLPTTEDTRNAKYNYCVATGWGFTESYGNSADILQRVELPIMNLTQCRDIYQGQSKVKITHKQVCAGGKGNKDSCPGDSGGPMQVATYINDDTRYVQQGVVSFGHRFCGTEGYPGVYTRIPYYMDWILDNIKP